MRLLEIKDDCTVHLTKYLNNENDVPPYAILSHTWQEGEEVTLHDLENNTGGSKAGWSKIQFCAQQAKCDQLRHFWIDTCCINKADHVELQIAINSMFRWYRNAATCYVFLSDVWAGQQHHPSAREEAFRNSRWFTRGWTLQELLAPRVVGFYSRNGMYLGDRLALKQKIHEITGIPISALAGAPLDVFSVEERLSWSNKRHTTYREDRAYALLGIFKVFLLPNYGEGGDNAFERLRNEIYRPLLKLKERVDQNTQHITHLANSVQQIQCQMNNRPKELGYPWESSVPESQLIVDDGLGDTYHLPTQLCETPEVIGTHHTHREKMYLALRLPDLLQPSQVEVRISQATWTTTGPNGSLLTMGMEPTSSSVTRKLVTRCEG